MTDQWSVHPVKPQSRPLPCEERCPKCGSLDILRRFLERGTEVPHEDYDKCKSKYATGQCHSWHATRDHIHQHCRCCQFSWQTLPLRKARLLQGVKDSAAQEGDK